MILRENDQALNLSDAAEPTSTNTVGAAICIGRMIAAFAVVVILAGTVSPPGPSSTAPSPRNAVDNSTHQRLGLASSCIANAIGLEIGVNDSEYERDLSGRSHDSPAFAKPEAPRLRSAPVRPHGMPENADGPEELQVVTNKVLEAEGPFAASTDAEGLRPDLPAGLVTHLTGLPLEGFPAESPFQTSRPSWAVDMSPEERERLRVWLAAFYGVSANPLNTCVPLAPHYKFVAVGMAVSIKVSEGVAEFTYDPRASTAVSSIDQLVDVLSTWRRQPITVELSVDGGEKEYITVEGWLRPEFIHLAITKRPWKERVGRNPMHLARGKRGNAEHGCQFGVIPLDIDLAGGDHAAREDGLRLPEPAELQQILKASELPWGSTMLSAGGAYPYLRLAEPLNFEHDAERCKEILIGVQREISNASKARGIHVDEAFTSGVSLCRVPFSIQTKYVWKGKPVSPLECPDLAHHPCVAVDRLEERRELGRSQRIKRKRAAHEDRIRRHGNDVPPRIARHLNVFAKENEYCRILVFRDCPICGRGGDTAHISEETWRLTCKRATCAAGGGLPYKEWIRLLPKEARGDLLAHIKSDIAWQRIVEHSPLGLEGPPTHSVTAYREGRAVVQRELERHHRLGGGQKAVRGASSRMLLLGADCGAGKTQGAVSASGRIPISYSAHQYTLLDEFGLMGHRPYQIQGLQKGCTINGLGGTATPRGVSRNYLCSDDKDRCPHLAKCLAQPRIESGKTPTCVHAALPTVGFGAVVRDGQVLYGDDAGQNIAANHLSVIDEVPELWNESVCTLKNVDEAFALEHFNGYRSLVRGEPLTEAEDAICRLSVLYLLLARLSEAMGLEAAKGRIDYALTWNADRVGEVVHKLGQDLDGDENFKDWRSLFRLGKVQDLTEWSGERLCIPPQRGWTYFGGKHDRRTKEHVRQIIPQCIVDACRAVAAVLEGEEGDSRKLVARYEDGEAYLAVLKLNSLTLPGSTGVAIMTAGAQLLTRLLPAVFPNRERRVVNVALEQQSLTKRVLLATSSLKRGAASRAFGEEGRQGSESEPAESSVESSGNASRYRQNYLSSLGRAMDEAANQVRMLRAEGVFSSDQPQRTLLVAFEPVVRWLIESKEGATWLRRNTPRELEIEPGEPWHADT